MRLFTTFPVAKRYGVIGGLSIRSVLKEIFALYEVEANDAFEESTHTNARVTAGASAKSKTESIERKRLVPEKNLWRRMCSSEPELLSRGTS